MSREEYNRRLEAARGTVQQNQRDAGTYSRAAITNIALYRGYSWERINKFLSIYGNKESGYTVDMLDIFENSINVM